MLANAFFYLKKIIIKAILVGVRWYPIVVLIFISLMTNNLKHFLMYLLAFVYLLLRNTYLSLLLTFKLSCLSFCC